MIDKSSNVTRIIDKLLDKNLVIRNENPENRRQVNIRITEKGLALLNEIESSAKFEKLKNINFNEEKARLMNQWLDEIRDLI
jgi:DNA-binding MarR family transcriptional regulator